MKNTKKNLKITQSDRPQGSYYRNTYKQDTIYTFYQYKEIFVLYNRSTGTLNCTDTLSDLIFHDGLISWGQKLSYEMQLRRYFTPIDTHDEKSIEQIYSGICALRREFLGLGSIEKEFELSTCRGTLFDPTDGIDQRAKKEEMIVSCDALIFILCQPELSWLMEKDIRSAQSKGKKIHKIIYRERDVDLEDIPGDDHLQKLIDERNVGIFFYGEEGLLHCKNLLVDAIVYAVPSGYYTRALTNQFGIDQACVVYVPAEFDITKWVPLTEKTILSYWQLAKLWEAYGDAVYAYTVEELYQKYPQFFLNIYQNGICCPEAEEGYPIQIYSKPSNVMTQVNQFYHSKDQAISDYLNSFENLTYVSAYFGDCREAKEITWDKTPKQGIMVHALKAKQVKGSCVINCEGYPTLREMLRAEVKKEGKKGKLQIYSNFLFFLTPKLSRLYNDLRADRPLEQINCDKMHLDYMLCEVNGNRVETFPLFQKACIAMKSDGKFRFFNFRLGGGRIKVGGEKIIWSEKDVDVCETLGTLSEQNLDQVRIYTPYYSISRENADSTSFRIPVGEDRVNLVIIQNQIICIRRGSVILPSIGVVVSMDERTGESFLQRLGLTPIEEGYYECNKLDIAIDLDSPDEIPTDEWRQVQWAYGGGLSLILDGKGLFDDDKDKESGASAAMLHMLRNEGWLSPLSCQTQESALHKQAKHPRTAIGTTEDGSLVIIVYSGRSHMSLGADYDDMITIARKLFPTIKNLMNVDGGGSAMLGMAIEGNFMELSYPATSTESCAGMVRPVNTVFCLDI